jgi:hypothetical protein
MSLGSQRQRLAWVFVDPSINFTDCGAKGIPRFFIQHRNSYLGDAIFLYEGMAQSVDFGC